MSNRKTEDIIWDMVEFAQNNRDGFTLFSYFRNRIDEIRRNKQI